jgi:hypothetical protein
MFYLVSSNGYTTSSIHLQTLGQATETYLAMRRLPAFKDAVWTLKTEQHWLHDHANGSGKPDWWYEVAPDLHAPYRDGRPAQTAQRDGPRPVPCPGGRGRPPKFTAAASHAARAMA